MKKLATSVLILSVIFSFNQYAFAVGSAGFENASFSAASIGEGNAVVAQAEEPAAISYNPAGLSYLPGVQIESNVGLISSFTRHSVNNGIDYSAGTIHPVPTGYLTINPGHYLNDRLAFGVGSDSPFGLANKYDSNLPQVRYAGWNNYLKMYTIKPVASIKLADGLSIGGGPIYYRVTDFGGVQAYPNKALGIPTLPDGQVRLNLSGNTWGWQMGTLIKPHKKHQFGFYFRSPVTIFTRGLIKVEDATVGGNFETGGNAKLDLPLNFTWAYAFKPTERDTIEVDLGYTRWSAHKRLFFNADPVNSSDDALLAAIGKAEKNYDDSWSIHLGGHHKFNEKFTLRGGSFFFTNAVPDSSFIPAVPDANRLAFTVGGGYKISKNMNLDMSYLSEFALRRKINNSISESIGGSVDGNYFSYIQGLYLSFTYKWDNLFPSKKGKKTTNEVSEI